MIDQVVFSDIQEALLYIFGPFVGWYLVLLVVVSLFLAIVVFFVYTLQILGRNW